MREGVIVSGRCLELYIRRDNYVRRARQVLTRLVRAHQLTALNHNRMMMIMALVIVPMVPSHDHYFPSLHRRDYSRSPNSQCQRAE